MNRFLGILLGALLAFPAVASVDHWTCSNEQTVMFMVLDTDAGTFILWDDKGQFLATAKFSKQAHTKDGKAFAVAELSDGVLVGVAKADDGSLVLGLSGEKGAVKFICN